MSKETDQYNVVYTHKGMVCMKFRNNLIFPPGTVTQDNIYIHYLGHLMKNSYVSFFLHHKIGIYSVKSKKTSTRSFLHNNVVC